MLAIVRNQQAPFLKNLAASISCDKAVVLQGYGRTICQRSSRFRVHDCGKGSIRDRRNEDADENLASPSVRDGRAAGCGLSESRRNNQENARPKKRKRPLPGSAQHQSPPTALVCKYKLAPPPALPSAVTVKSYSVIRILYFLILRCGLETGLASSTIQAAASSAA
jgi:hypothetical protein